MPDAATVCDPVECGNESGAVVGNDVFGSSSAAQEVLEDEGGEY